jgi:hypothetical protein
MPFTIRWDNGGPVHVSQHFGSRREMYDEVNRLFEEGNGYVTVFAIADGFETGRMAWR